MSASVRSIVRQPSDWIAAQPAARLLRDRIVAAIGDADPTPWLPNNAQFNGGFSADDARSNRLIIRIATTLQFALLNGRFTACLFDEQDYKPLPTAAFKNGSVIIGGITLQTFEINPLWPDEWQRWSGCGWVLHKEQFNRWLATAEAVSGNELPPVAEGVDGVERLASRQPSDRAYVPLSEAVTWIAFGLALDSERMMRTLSWRSLCSGSFAEVDRRLKEAAEKLFDAGVDGKVPFKGRHLNLRGERGALTDTIQPTALNDYRQFNIYGEDVLRYGRGFTITRRTANDFQHHESGRPDLFTDVTVDRAELLSAFPDRNRVGSAVASKSAGELDCKAWLALAFAQDKDRKRTKDSFKQEALNRFAGRLSTRGFLRVWESIAATHGRSSPGRKS